MTNRPDDAAVLEALRRAPSGEAYTWVVTSMLRDRGHMTTTEWVRGRLLKLQKQGSVARRGPLAGNNIVWIALQ